MKQWICVILFSVVGMGCEDTSIVFHNMVPNASVTNARWAPDGTNVTYDSSDRLGPGQKSDTIVLWAEEGAGASGTLSFELEVEGNRVALVADEKFTAGEGQTTTFELTPELAVHNPLVIPESE